MKKYLYIIGCILGVLLVVMLVFKSFQVHKIQQQLNYSISKEKAYISERDSLETESRLFQVTIQQLTYYKDTLTDKLLAKSKEVQIKENKLKQLQYLATTTTKKDTLILKDTVFRDYVNIDTMLTSKHYQLNLILKYPNYIEVIPTFNDELFIFITSKKETIDPPSKICFIRWLQPKHIIQEIVIKNTNPFVKIKQTRFIEIVKLSK